MLNDVGMNVGIYNSATTLGSLEQWQTATSQNIAASNIPGYKGNQMSFESIHAGYVGIMSEGNAIQTPTSMAISSSEVNFKPGQLNPTGADTHMAINGEGFFKIEGDGFEYYTRDGEFHLDGNDQLVTKNGDPVLGENGPINVNPALGKITVSPEGEVMQGSVAAGKIGIYNTDDKNALVRITGGFRVDPEYDVNMEAVESPTVVQGSLEGSNVNALNEMVNLIGISRAYELNSKVIQSLDDIQGKTIETMGDTN